MAVEQLWGPETSKAVDNFPVSGERLPVAVVRMLGRVKAAAARTNAALGLLDSEVAERIAAAGDEVAAGAHDEQFPIDVFQTGSGTSSNMNANEVIASIAGEGAHPNDHVNMGQSSNDVFPSAVHLAAVGETTTALLPALDQLAASLEAKAAELADTVKAGRTHMMDAVPVTLGQELAGYAAQVRLGHGRVGDALPRASQIPLGGTATGTGLNTHPDFAEGARGRLREATGLPVEGPADPFEAQANRDGLVELSGALKVVAVSLTKIANDLVLMGSGPRTGLGEIALPELQKGSSIMPGKVNPVIPEVVLQVAAQVIGNDAAITIAGTQGAFELNVRVPVIARNLLDSIAILSSASRLLAEKCVDGIEANVDALTRHAESTPAIATALNPHIGYDRASEIVKEAVASRRTVREVALEQGVDEATLDEALDLHRMARGSGDAR
jgi:fumarate hydratase class II